MTSCLNSLNVKQVFQLRWHDNPNNHTYSVCIVVRLEFDIETRQSKYHLCFQRWYMDFLHAVAAVAEVQDDNKGYYALHTAVR